MIETFTLPFLHVDHQLSPCEPVGLLLPAECDGWSPANQSPLSSPAQRLSSPEAEEEEAASEQRSVTETVINGSMKETLSLTVDAKTETAVFKRLEQWPRGHRLAFHGVRMALTHVESCFNIPDNVNLCFSIKGGLVS